MDWPKSAQHGQVVVGGVATDGGDHAGGDRHEERDDERGHGQLHGGGQPLEDEGQGGLAIA